MRLHIFSLPEIICAHVDTLGVCRLCSKLARVYERMGSFQLCHVPGAIANASIYFRILHTRMLYAWRFRMLIFIETKNAVFLFIFAKYHRRRRRWRRRRRPNRESFSMRYSKPTPYEKCTPKSAWHPRENSLAMN